MPDIVTIYSVEQEPDLKSLRKLAVQKNTFSKFMGWQKITQALEENIGYNYDGKTSFSYIFIKQW